MVEFVLVGFTGITAWLNTPGGKPLPLSALRGKVILVDFWTYSCINCQRTLPHVEAWYREYAKDGFVVVGVHTPEFAFEHVVSNVRAQAAALGVRYPVAIDDNYATWNAYSNQYWPADYLIDAQGDVRSVHFGEGGYGHHTQTIDVGGTPRLYTLYQADSATTGTLLLHASPGVEAYDFTFG
jgi:thiol-disulfide isomerase/thioredoxin